MTRAFALLTALILATSLAVPAQAAFVCKPPMVGPYAGHAKNKNFARGLARTAWKAKVTAKWNPSWSNWSNARDKTYKCLRRTSLIGTNGWVCRTNAKPCKHQ